MRFIAFGDSDPPRLRTNLLDNPNSVSQLKMWLEERGLTMDTLGKKQVAAQIKELDTNGCDAELLEMLKLRLQMAKSSVKKYQAAERAVSADGRARGLFRYYGANHTGRWAGRSIQLQNLPQNHLSTLDEARELLKIGAFESLEMLYGNTPDVLSQLIRTMLIPKPGCEFVVADFSAIEARVLAWLAGEQWRLDSFNAGADIYCAPLAVFGVPW
jgi:DNA polymerase